MIADHPIHRIDDLLPWDVGLSKTNELIPAQSA